MKKIIAFGGSNSKASINKKLAVYSANKVEDIETIVLDLKDYQFPLYGIDLENEIGIPSKVKELDNLIESVDGLIISLAEHNGSYTVAFKNVLDWLSRIDQKVWKNKPMLLLSASPGGRGGANVLNAAKSSFPHFGGNIIADFSLPKFNANFSVEDEDILDKELNDLLNKQIELFSKVLHKA